MGSGPVHSLTKYVHQALISYKKSQTVTKLAMKRAMCLDNSHFGLALAVGVLALTFGLRVPSHVCFVGDVTMGGLVVNTHMLDACVAAGKTLLVMSEYTRNGLSGYLALEDLRVYKETLRVVGVLTMSQLLAAVFTEPCHWH